MGTLEANCGGVMITNIAIAILVVAAIWGALVTHREKKQAEKSQRDGDRSFRLHLRTLDRARR
jgi:hypothetical protein